MLLVWHLGPALQEVVYSAKACPICTSSVLHPLLPSDRASLGPLAHPPSHGLGLTVIANTLRLKDAWLAMRGGLHIRVPVQYLILLSRSPGFRFFQVIGRSHSGDFQVTQQSLLAPGTATPARVLRRVSGLPSRHSPRFF